MKVSLLIFIILVFVKISFAGKALTSAFEFLRTDFNPRTAAMSNAFTTVRGDVGSILINPAGMAFNGTDQYLFNSRESKYMLDLSLANKLGLQKAGVLDIEVINICTKCNDSFYSYRREGRGVNTQLSFIALKQ